MTHLKGPHEPANPCPQHPAHTRHGRRLSYLPGPDESIDPVGEGEIPGPARRPVLPLSFGLGPGGADQVTPQPSAVSLDFFFSQPDN